MEDKRERGDRADEEQVVRERRYNGNLTRMEAKRLQIYTEDQLDDKYEHRWVVDHLNRITQMEKYDYDFVGASQIKGYVASDTNSESDERIRLICGRHENGLPKYSYLMRKRKEWYDTDRAAIDQRRKAKMSQGKVVDAKGNNVNGDNTIIQANLDNFGGKRVRSGKIA